MSEQPPVTDSYETTRKPVIAPPRVVGPVTAGAGGGVAAATIICWLVEVIWHVQVPLGVQGSLSLLLGIVGGYLVRTTGKPQGRYEA